jgi:hypothetical protein
VTRKLSELAEAGKNRETKIAAIRNEMEACLDQAPNPEALRQVLEAFGEAFHHLEPEDKARLIRLAVKEVVYDGQKNSITTSLRPLGSANGGLRPTQLQSVSEVWLLDLDSNQEPFD